MEHCRNSVAFPWDVAITTSCYSTSTQGNAAQTGPYTHVDRNPREKRSRLIILRGGREGKGERNSATDDDRATASGDQPSTPLSSVAWSTTVTVAVGREIAACDLRLADDPEKKEKRENREDWRAGGVRHSVFNNSARITFDGITNLRLTREPCGF